MIFYLKRTFKVVLTLLFITILCNIFNLTFIDSLAEHIPTVILTVALLDLSDELYAKFTKLFNWLINKLTNSNLSKRWDLEEKINNLKLRFAGPVALIVIIVYFLLKWLWV